jgi:hypothetical protein
MSRPAKSAMHRTLWRWGNVIFPDGRSSAQAAVELAITIPVVLLLILGMINLGSMVNAQIILTQAAWEGARAGATLDISLGEGDDQIYGAVRRALAGLDPDQIQIEIDPSEDQHPRDLPGPQPRGTPLTVTLEYPLALSLPFPLVVDLSSQATSRIEYSNP